ncbi:MAG: hypothetical protein KA716_33145 [Gloeotrichia echinulata DEX184]
MVFSRPKTLKIPRNHKGFSRCYGIWRWLRPPQASPTEAIAL